MREPSKVLRGPDKWKPIRDPEDRYSTGIPDFDRLLGGGFQRGSMALFDLDETVGREEIDLLLFPTFLNLLYQSRGIIAVLPTRDSPHGFRSRLTRFVTRRRFDSRVRVIDYVGEDEGPPYVVNLKSMREDAKGRAGGPKEREKAMAKMEAAERAVQGNRKKSFLELNAFEVLDMLVGAEKATQMFFYGVKRARHVGNLVIGLLGPGLGCAAGVRRMADTELALHRDEVGLIIRGVRPSFSSYVVTPDLAAGPPHVAFVPRPS
jgi:gas vesicle operon resressor